MPVPKEITEVLILSTVALIPLLFKRARLSVILLVVVALSCATYAVLITYDGQPATATTPSTQPPTAAPAGRPASPRSMADVNALDVPGWHRVEATGTEQEQLCLVTKYKKIRGETKPQELTYVEFPNGLAYTGSKVPNFRLGSEYTWGRREVAARNPEAPDDPDRSIWVEVWTPVRMMGFGRSANR